MDNTYTRLAKPRRKGVLSLIFSRTAILVVLFALQILIYVGIFGYFEQYMPGYAIISEIFQVFMVLYLINCGMDSTSKVTWMFLIALFPFAASLFLLITRTDIGHRNLRKSVTKQIENSRGLLKQSEDVLKKLSESGTDYINHFLNLTGTFPVYDDTEVTYYPTGEKAYAAMLEDLKKASEYIYMEFFIIEEGHMWGGVLDILLEKVKAGVDVRVMYDGMCEITKLPYNYARKMEAVGIHCHAFSPLTPFLSTYYNYRDHRKILVIDGHTAYTGGINFADEYINAVSRFGHWKDVAIRVEGGAAISFTSMFLQMWNLREPDTELGLPVGTAPKVPVRASGFCMPFADEPLDKYRVGEIVYIDMLYRARDYVHIMTPYLILNSDMENALKYAAERGVDVKLILPGIPDKKPAYALAKSHYHALVSAGVKIYEYDPGFVHAKVFVSDDVKAVVGSINLDYRSLYHHFECAAYLYGNDCIRDIEADFNETLSKCSPVTPETIKKEHLFYRIAGPLLKVFAPLM